jgi:BolA protein
MFHALRRSGLSGSTADEIQKVDPQFIQAAEIGPTLTPGRNNGFLNMLATMKKKAVQLDRDASDSSDSAQLDATTALDLDSDAPMYNGIISALQMLKPTKLVLVDNSDQHAGHAGNKGFNGESHFELEIVADAFTGLNLVKRHQLIYLMLREIMPKIHALQIRANTPDEVGQPE